MSRPDQLSATLMKLTQSEDPAVAVAAAGHLVTLKTKAETREGFRNQLADLKKQLTAAQQAAAERDTLAEQVAELRPLADRLPALEEELNALKQSIAADHAQMRTELLFTAEAKLRQAKNFEEAARVKYAADPLSYSVREWQAMAAKSPMPDFWSEEARKHSALFWASWMTEEQATVWTSLAKACRPEDPASRRYIITVLAQTVPHYSTDFTDSSPIVTSNSHQVSFVTALARRMGILSEVSQEIETLKVRKFNEHQLHMNYVREQQQIEMTKKGYGRSPIGQFGDSEPSSRVPLSEHVLGCCCVACGGTGIPDRLRMDTSLGTARVVQAEDINEPSPLSVAARAMEREAHAKRERQHESNE